MKLKILARATESFSGPFQGSSKEEGGAGGGGGGGGGGKDWPVPRCGGHAINLIFFLFSVRCCTKVHSTQLGSPTNNALLIIFLLSSVAEIFVTNPRLSMQVGTKCEKTCVQHVHVLTELPFCMPPLLVGKGRERERERKSSEIGSGDG